MNGNHLDPLCQNSLPASLPRIGHHGLRRLLHDVRLVPLGNGIFGRGLDAKVGRQTDDVHVRHVLLLQPLGQPAVADVKGVMERRVHFYAVILPLVDDLVDLREVEFGDELRPGGILDAVDGPEGRRVGAGRVRGVADRRAGGEGLRGRVVAREGDVGAGVPVAGGDFEGEREGEERVDGVGDGAGGGDGEGAVLRAVRGRIGAGAGAGGDGRAGRSLLGSRL